MKPRIHARIHRGHKRDCPSPTCHTEQPAAPIITVLNSPEFIGYARRREREWDEGKIKRSQFSRYNH
jgi:hypothetical protein